MGKLLTIFALIGAVLCMVKCDESDDIKEPCKNSDDLKNCVRDYFRKNGHCRVIENPSNDPVLLPGRHNAYVSVINTTYGLTDVYLTHFENEFETFHINKKSGKLILSVDFKGVGLESDHVHFVFYRRSKEPLVVIDYAKGTFPVIITAVFPTSTDISGEDVSNAMISAYIAHPEETKFSIGPKFAQSNDPQVALAAKQLAENLPTALQELFLTGAPDIFIKYLQNFICDFGVKVPY